MFVCDQITLGILDVNENVVNKLGYSREEIIGLKLLDIGNRVSFDGLGIKLGKETSDIPDELWQMNKKDGTSKIVQFSSHIINYQGHPAKLIVAHDVTEIQNRDVEYNDLLSTPIGFQDFPMAEIEWNRDLKILRWSKKAEELFGWSQEEVIGSKDILKRFIHPDDYDFVLQELNDTIRNKKKNASLTNRNVTKSGDIISCEWYNSFLFNADGEVVSVYSLVTDVTTRVDAMERSLRVMESYRDLFDSISDAIYLINEAGEIVGANKGVELTFGYDPDWLIGKHYKTLAAPGKFIPDRIFEAWKNPEENGHSSKYEGWGRKNNGEVFPTEMLVNNGSYFGQQVLIIIERDVSDRKIAEEELQKRERLLGELFNTSPLGIALLNEHLEVIEVNEGFENLFGHKLDEIKGLELDRLIVPDEFMEHAKKLSMTPKVKEVTGKRLTKNGDLVDVMIYSVPIFMDGKMINKYGIYVDITDRKEAEEQLMSSLKEKEVLLAEIHHRVKNNLAVITGLLELQSYNTGNENARDILRESQMRINSIAMVHEKLYHNERLSEIKIHNYIKELSKVVQKTMRLNSTKVKLSFNLDPVSLQITQAIPCGLLLNEVLTNSFKHAFPDRDKGKVSIDFKVTDDDHLCFRIKDDGVGFDTSMLNNSKKSLGMKLIRTLSKQLNAKTNIQSDGKGAEFNFKFKKEG
jgi:PAS domain S-box-containing protein